VSIRTSNAKPLGRNKSRPRPNLQAELKARVENTNLFQVSVDMEIGRSALQHYVAGLPMHTVTVRGIEATMGYLPEAKSATGASRR
jgi:hypothetical protein